MQANVYSSDFEEYLKSVDILYVEDEERIRELVETRLLRHFGNIYTAPNGEVGLYRFDTHRPKIIITDICMPVMDGLEMLATIREKNPHVKIIVTTAHNDMDYIMKSIDIGIDKYITKPINIENLVASIKKIAFHFYNENLAKEYQRKNVEEQISIVMKSVFEQMSHSMPNPMILYSSNKPIFMNNAFCELFSSQDIGRISSAEIKLDEFLNIHVAYGGMNRTSIALPTGRKKIFGVSKTAMNINEQVDATLYMFNDLTMLEYQNAKLQSYADTLYDLLRAKKAVQAVCTKPAQDGPKDDVTAKTESLSSLLNAHEMDALKRSHTVKTSAKEYVQDISEDILDELDELSEIEMEVGDMIDLFDDNGDNKLFMEFGNRFVAYSHSIGKLIEFEDLAIAVRNFGEFLIASQSHSDIKWSKLLSYVRNIRLDLVSWRRTIFIDCIAQDIHYLDSSMLSSCIQAQLNSGSQTSSIEDENDLELF